MRSIAVGMIVVSVMTTVVDMGQAQQGPLDHRQPILTDLARPDEVNPQESGLARVIQQENERLDRLLRGICRGC
jgi:hypothetical protein